MYIVVLSTVITLPISYHTQRGWHNPKSLTFVSQEGISTPTGNTEVLQ